MRLVCYCLRLIRVALNVIFAEGWQRFQVKFKNWCHRLASGQIAYEIAAERRAGTSIHDHGAFAEDMDYISEVVRMLKNRDQLIDLDEKNSLEVIVPIYNAYGDFLKCLFSLIKHQDVYRIILLDDCSTDGRIKDLLETLKPHENEWFRIEVNSENLGYLKTANKGMRLTKSDIILLNTDTIVTAGWARKMRACAYSEDGIATVTPFTNNGRMCSVPEFLQNNQIPEGFTVESFAECIQSVSSSRYPELVTAVGFCMYIRRSIIDEVGYFDDVNFEKGYGEEVDFSFRAARRGYKNVLCDNTFVFHRGRASFLDSQETVMERNHNILAEKYPDFWAAIALFERSNPLKEFQDKLKAEIKARQLRRDKSHGWPKWRREVSSLDDGYRGAK